MLKLVILIVVFAFIFWIIYKEIKKIMLFWLGEISEEDNLENRMNKLKIERSRFDEDLNEKSNQLKKETKNIERMKKKGF